MEYLLTLHTIDVSACAECVPADDDGDVPDGSDGGVNGKSALHIAAIHDSVKIAEMLIESGCPLCVQDLEVSQGTCILCNAHLLMLLLNCVGKYSSPRSLQKVKP